MELTLNILSPASRLRVSSCIIKKIQNNVKNTWDFFYNKARSFSVSIKATRDYLSIPISFRERKERFFAEISHYFKYLHLGSQCSF